MALYLCNMHKYLQAFGKIRLEWTGGIGWGPGLSIRRGVFGIFDEISTVVRISSFSLVQFAP